MPDQRPLRIAIVAGEESGNLLGADLVRALREMSGREIELRGVGGRALQELGLKTLFDPADIALMGVTAVLRDLPRLIRRIGSTARAIAAAEPDCLITIDSPDFTLRVSEKLRGVRPGIPIIHYVCPSVWAWRPQRAPRMRAFVDHVLCMLPFEPAELQRLGGPPGVYVGHRLTHDPAVAMAAAAQTSRATESNGEKALVVLPGSRRGEVKALAEPFGRTVSILRQRGHRLRLLLPTLPHLEALVRSLTSGWEQVPEILLGPDAKFAAFAQADAGLAASGTVSLELALSRVPFIVAYKTDGLMRLMRSRIGIWSASLPNLIADQPVAQEYYDEMVRPGHMARQLELLMADTEVRQAQLAGFEKIARTMQTDRPAGVIAAEVVLAAIEARQGRRDGGGR